MRFYKLIILLLSLFFLLSISGCMTYDLPYEVGYAIGTALKGSSTNDNSNSENLQP